MKKIASVLLFGVLFPTLLFGQGETANWYFGNEAGIQFNADGSVTPVNKSSLTTFEGCASISDAAGDLLFYTDGITVYNRNHDLMENGSKLLGDSSSTQSALIVPHPDNSFLFYVFTVDTRPFTKDPDLGLNYSVVDMRMDNGYGSVIEKNINLLQDCSEKISAVVKDCFDRSIWVLTLASENGDANRFDTFHAFEVNATGVQTTAVKSPIAGLQFVDPRGYLKFSPDGNFLASANASDGLYLYDFDATTGEVSNGRRLYLPTYSSSPYGVEFSPNNRFLYVHSSNDVLTPSGHLSSLLQFDLKEPDPQDSMVELHRGANFRGALQLAENGKIYRTIAENYGQGTPYLGVIHDPNLKGTSANYEHEAIFLGAGNATQGLPPFIQSFFGGGDLVRNPDGSTESTLARCTGDAFVLEADNISGATYLWEKDGVPLNSITGNILEVIDPDPLDSGRYKVEILLPDPDECPVISNAQVYILPIPDPVLGLTQCDLDSSNSTDGITNINLTEINDNPNIEFFLYESISDRTSDNPITEIADYRNTQAFNQTLYYKAVNSLGCTNFGELQLEISPVTIEDSAYGPFSQCDMDLDDDKLSAIFDLDDIAENYGGLNVSFYLSLEDAALEQNALSGSFDTQPITLFARLENAGQCQGVEVIDLNVNPSPMLEMQSTFSLCTDGGGISLSAPGGFDSYRWLRTIEGDTKQFATGREVRITELGEYALQGGYDYNANTSVLTCYNEVSFSVVASNRAIIDDIIISDFSTNNTVQVDVSGDGDYEYSLDGSLFQQSNFFEGVEPGFFTVFVRDRKGCGITEKEISVLGYPKFFTPNGDGVNDFWQVTGVSGLFEPDAFISIYDRYGTFVTQISPAEEGWNGNNASRSLPASDYWFKVLLKDGREITGHFALKR